MVARRGYCETPKDTAKRGVIRSDDSIEMAVELADTWGLLVRAGTNVTLKRGDLPHINT